VLGEVVFEEKLPEKVTRVKKLGLVELHVRKCEI
jgi:hypothetical protein